MVQSSKIWVRTKKNSKFGYPCGKADEFKTIQITVSAELNQLNQLIQLNIQKYEIQPVLWVDIDNIDNDGNFLNPDSQHKSLEVQKELLWMLSAIGIVLSKIDVGKQG